MKNPRVLQRLACLGGAVEMGRNRVMIRFPDPRLLRLVARAAILLVAIFSLPWLRNAVVSLLSGSSAASPSLASGGDNGGDSFFPELLRNLKGLGLLLPDSRRAVFLGDPAFRLPLLAENRVEPVVGEEAVAAVAAGTLDFVFAGGDEAGLGFANRALKIGGVAAITLGAGAASNYPFRIPSNFRMVYIRRFESTVIAMRKVATAPAEVVVAGARNELRRRRMGRRLLAVREAKKEALINGLEDVALEPPAKGQLLLRRRRTRYLADLLGDSLAEYPRRLFVDVGPAGRSGSEGWFARHYPMRHLDFEIIRVDVNDAVVGGSGSGGGDALVAADGGGISDWLRRNVREEDYVVMKAEAEAVEEMVKGRAIGLVDELFLECRNQWQKEKGGVKSWRAYWECLALYGKLRDEGVAVHQWWD
ncbi:hypothetical protein AXF42_Ash001943 [Apostasia shenzhenica]|uniref:DUF7870 domain-containing protein n=1 Tax=Apostasia shenzhenica TaxID=1088818 RepID=A0A2I0ABN9_9ASPA|nr:hypothetical protein AXF42_Ash001943 [Apostasia shenzhenica]